MSSVGGSQKKRKAVVRKESSKMQDYVSDQQNDMEVDGDKSLARQEVKRRVFFF